MTAGTAEIARRIRDGEWTAESVARACLERIASRESDIGAWAHVNPDAVLERARALDRALPRGVLHGVPIGVKDVIDTSDQPTGHGSPIYAGHRPARDAACVVRLRDAGALILGKTVTAEFAFAHPGGTRHPLATAHTPGGSSSGSAAAVADGMVPAALGTQTGGSTIRPSAFCGIVGYKPAFGSIPTEGLKPLAPSLDTIGVLARRLEDIPLLTGVLTARPVRPVRDGPPRLALCRTPYWDRAGAPARSVLLETMEAAREAGAKTREIELPAKFARLDDAHRVVMSAEVARSMDVEWRADAARLSEAMRAFIERGRRETAEDVRTGWALASDCRRRLRALCEDGEVLVTLSAPGEAPRGLASTGDAVFCRLWTLLAPPCLHLPVSRGPSGLPLGVQLVAPEGDEGALFGAAEWMAEHLS
ncbi:MAG: amidase [Chromatiales bacterium]|nr:amidase [Chromatiales bacterium]